MPPAHSRLVGWVTMITGGRTMAKGNNARKKETKKPKKDKAKK